MTITPKITKNIAGMWLKPNIPANGVKGKINVMQITPNVATINTANRRAVTNQTT